MMFVNALVPVPLMFVSADVPGVVGRRLDEEIGGEGPGNADGVS